MHQKGYHAPIVNRKRLLRHPGGDALPEITAGATTALPGASIDEPEGVDDAGLEPHLVAQQRRHDDGRLGPARLVQVHLRRRLGRVDGPVDLVAVQRSWHRRVRGVAGGVRDGDHRAVVHDEVAPYLLEGLHEGLAGADGPLREVSRQVGSVVGRRDGVLVLPTLLVACVGVGEPVRWAVEGRLGEEVE